MKYHEHSHTNAMGPFYVTGLAGLQSDAPIIEITGEPGGVHIALGHEVDRAGAGRLIRTLTEASR